LARTAESAESIECFAADLRDRLTSGAAVRRAVELWGRVDIVVNNAGGTIRADLESVLAEQMDELFAVYVVAPTLLTPAAVPWLRKTRGCVVNVSSTFGHRPSPGSAHHGAAKSALEHLTRISALELAPDGVRGNAVAPGPAVGSCALRCRTPVGSPARSSRSTAGSNCSETPAPANTVAAVSPKPHVPRLLV
jgi:NAD(P)-dependent dehydrogenase (short-subunit alcohol dehydrogenase family)